MLSEYGSLPFPICHQLLSGQLDQCARLSFPCSLSWIQSLQLIFLSTKLNTYVCVCVSCSDEFDYIALSNFDLFKDLQYQLHSIFDKNFVDCSRMNIRQVFLKSKKMSSVGVLKKNLSVLWEKKNLSVRRKIFKVWRGRKIFKYRISGVRKKRIERKVLRKDFWMEILLSSCSLVGLFR